MEYIIASLVVAALVYLYLNTRSKPKNPPGLGGGQSGNKNQPK